MIARRFAGVVPAVDAAAGKIDDHIRAVEFLRPRTESRGVPGDGSPWSLARMAAEDDNLMAVGAKRPRQERPDLTRAAGDDDLHVSGLQQQVLVDALER